VCGVELVISVVALVPGLEQRRNRISDGKLRIAFSRLGDGMHLRSNWERYADRIGQLLAAGLPIAFEKGEA